MPTDAVQVPSERICSSFAGVPSGVSTDGTSVRSAYAPGLVVLTDQRGNVKRRLFDVHGRLTRVE